MIKDMEVRRHLANMVYARYGEVEKADKPKYENEVGAAYMGYEEGYEQAFKDTIEKACEWLKQTAYFFVNDLTGNFDIEGLIKDFKKAMKGGEE